MPGIPDDPTPPFDGDGLAKLMVELHEQLYRQNWLERQNQIYPDDEYTISREPFASDNEYLTQETLDRLKLRLLPSVERWKFEYIWSEKIHDYDWPALPYIPMRHPEND